MQDTVMICVIVNVFQLTLVKDHLGDDFGFSMSDGQTDNGVYVHTVKQGGPASRAGVLPFDRILQVRMSLLI